MSACGSEYMINIVILSSFLQRTSGTGLEYDDLRYELTEWKRKYIDVESVINFNNITAQTTQPDRTQLDKVRQSHLSYSREHIPLNSKHILVSFRYAH